VATDIPEDDGREKERKKERENIKRARCVPSTRIISSHTENITRASVYDDIMIYALGVGISLLRVRARLPMKYHRRVGAVGARAGAGAVATGWNSYCI
jgi:hypothetical protein